LFLAPPFALLGQKGELAAPLWRRLRGFIFNVQCTIVVKPIHTTPTVNDIKSLPPPPLCVPRRKGEARVRGGSCTYPPCHFERSEKSPRENVLQFRDSLHALTLGRDDRMASFGRDDKIN